MKFTIEIPESVPFPKYEMFQPVRCGKHHGRIMGMRYICPLDAIKEELDKPGWYYAISDLLGKEPIDYFSACDFGYETFEDDICPVAEEVPHDHS